MLFQFWTNCRQLLFIIGIWHDVKPGGNHVLASVSLLSIPYHSVHFLLGESSHNLTNSSAINSHFPRGTRSNKGLGGVNCNISWTDMLSSDSYMWSKWLIKAWPCLFSSADYVTAKFPAYNSHDEDKTDGFVLFRLPELPTLDCLNLPILRAIMEWLV